MFIADNTDSCLKLKNSLENFPYEIYLNTTSPLLVLSNTIIVCVFNKRRFATHFPLELRFPSTILCNFRFECASRFRPSGRRWISISNPRIVHTSACIKPRSNVDKSIVGHQIILRSFQMSCQNIFFNDFIQITSRMFTCEVRDLWPHLPPS